MKAKKPHSKPRSNKRREISGTLREEIITGVHALGSVFPRRSDLASRFRTTPVTIQHVMDQLRNEGFVYANGRRATYVSSHPPHLYHYAMVFSSVPPPNLQGWSRFFQALVQVATRFNGSGGDPRRVTIHYGVDRHVENQEMRKLEAGMRSQCFAGFIFPEEPFTSGLAQTPIGSDPQMPRVAIRGESMPFMAALGFDGQSLVDKALDYFAERGRKRIAIIANVQPPASLDSIVKGLKKRSMTMHPYWLQMVSLDNPQCARGTAHLLMHGGQDERPDGLFIADDNLVEQASAGIVDAGIRVPDDLDVVAHCNFPWPVPSVVAVKRLGYDAREILAACMDLIDEQRQGAPAGLRVVRAVFEEDLSAIAGKGTKSKNGTLAKS